jgi:2-haloacid dehalogenase
MSRVIVFDVNETLLDLSALDPEFERVFGDASVRREWFTQVLQLAFVSVATDRHADFGTAGRVALDMVARRRRIELPDEDTAAILGGMRRLPPHPEVPAALARLRDAGLRLAALTNSPKDAADAQLAHAGLFDFFEQVLSVDFARRLKPHRAVYQMAAERLGIEPGGMRMVAAHHWDVTGAMRAGCAGAFLARPGMVLGPLDEQPDVVGPDLGAVAEAILAVEMPR